VDGRALRDGLVQLARTGGATVVSGTATLQLRNGGVTGVRTESGLHAADAVVLAAGAWSGQVSPAVGNRVQPQRGQIVHLQLPGASALPTLDTIAGHYLLTFPGDRVVIGATRETGSGFDVTVTAGGLAQILAQGFSLVPHCRTPPGCPRGSVFDRSASTAFRCSVRHREWNGCGSPPKWDRAG